MFDYLMIVIVAYCNIIRAYQRGTNERRLFRQKMIKKNGHRKTFSQWNRFFFGSKHKFVNQKVFVLNELIIREILRQ